MLLERTGLDPRGIIALAKENPNKLRTILVRDTGRFERGGPLDGHISNQALAFLDPAVAVQVASLLPQQVRLACPQWMGRWSGGP